LKTIKNAPTRLEPTTCQFGNKQVTATPKTPLITLFCCSIYIPNTPRKKKQSHLQSPSGHPDPDSDYHHRFPSSVPAAMLTILAQILNQSQ
jgi:hypothetical protein